MGKASFSGLSGVVVGIGVVCFALFFSVAGAQTADHPARFEEKGGIAHRTKSQVLTDAYYLISELEGRGYLLGDSYDTGNPLIVKERELLRNFRAVDFVKIK